MRKIFQLFVLCALFSSVALAQTTNTCSTTPGTSLGSVWTMAQCIGITAEAGQSLTESIAMPNNVVAGNWLIALNEQCSYTWSGNGCPGGSSGSYEKIINSISSGTAVAAATGTVNTYGTTVQFVSGIPFSLAGCYWGTSCDWNGKTIKINGTNYTISQIQGPYQLTLTGSAGTQTGVSYTGPGWYCSETLQSGPAAQNFCLAAVTTGGSATIQVTSTTNNYSLGEVITEIHSSTGIANLDLGACPQLGCYGWAGFPISGVTNSLLNFYQITTSQANELVFFGGQYGGGTGSVTATSGWTTLVITTNQTETSVINVASAGPFTASQTVSTAGWYTGAQAIPLTHQ